MNGKRYPVLQLVDEIGIRALAQSPGSGASGSRSNACWKEGLPLTAHQTHRSTATGTGGGYAPTGCAAGRDGPRPGGQAPRAPRAATWRSSVGMPDGNAGWCIRISVSALGRVAASRSASQSSWPSSRRAVTCPSISVSSARMRRSPQIRFVVQFRPRPERQRIVKGGAQAGAFVVVAGHRENRHLDRRQDVLAAAHSRPPSRRRSDRR